MKRKLLIFGLILFSFCAAASVRLQVAEALLARERAVQFGTQMMKVQTAARMPVATRPYFVTTSSVSTSSFTNFVKGIANNETVKTALAALGLGVTAGNWSWSKDKGMAPQKGQAFYVNLGRRLGSSGGATVPDAIKGIIPHAYPDIAKIELGFDRDITLSNSITIVMKSGGEIKGYWFRTKCTDTSTYIKSCKPDYVPSTEDKTLPPNAVNGVFFSSFSKLPLSQKKALFYKDDKLAPLDWKPEITTEPKFSDGRALPPIGDPLWKSALDHSQGKAVPEDKAADARYLSDNVAKKDPTVLKKNATGSSTGGGGTKPEGGKVDLQPVIGAIDSLKKSNADELKGIKEQLKQNAKSPDLSKAGKVSCLVGLKCPSYVDLKYQNGLKGILDNFKTQISTSKLLKFLDNFRFSGNGNVTPPVWIIDLTKVDFLGKGLGRHDVSLPGYIWSFMRACLLFGTVMACRKIIFGG